MQFKNTTESALALSDKIKSEGFPDFRLFYISPDALDFCLKVADNLGQPLNLLETSISQHQGITGNIIILDDGSTRVGEFKEFTDYLRRHSPESNLIVAVPFIPQAEESQFTEISDSFITLYIEPLFFSVNQFYQNN